MPFSVRVVKDPWGAAARCFRVLLPTAFAVFFFLSYGDASGKDDDLVLGAAFAVVALGNAYAVIFRWDPETRMSRSRRETAFTRWWQSVSVGTRLAYAAATLLGLGVVLHALFGQP